MSGINSHDASIDNTLRPVSVKQLFDGMPVYDDIFNHSRDKLLMKSGNTLTVDHIERIQRLNDSRDTIYVSGRTYKSIVSKRPDIEIKKREDLEESTGYTAALVRVFELLQEITDTGKLYKNGFATVADELAAWIKETPPGVILELVNAIAPEDEYIPRHTINVSMLSGLLGIWLNLPDEQVDKLVLIGLLHDCGHALMPPSIMHISRKFSILEYNVIKMHAVYTSELLYDFSDDIRITAATHHERLDGSGYPGGLSADTITGATRIVTVADIYDAVVSARSYRPAISPFAALALLDHMVPHQIDTNVVEAMKLNLPKEFVGKPFSMSDGTICLVRDLDPKDIEYPTVEAGQRSFKTSKALHCVSLFHDN